jgi:CRP/FNR family transcriptional regulator, cyclic AMP receptor protein
MKRRLSFDPKSFLAKIGEGRRIDTYHKGRIVFSQGDPAVAVFYIQKVLGVNPSAPAWG